MQQHEVNHKYELLPKIRTHAFEYVDEKLGMVSERKLFFWDNVFHFRGWRFSIEEAKSFISVLFLETALPLPVCEPGQVCLFVCLPLFCWFSSYRVPLLTPPISPLQIKVSHLFILFSVPVRHDFFHFSPLMRMRIKATFVLSWVLRRMRARRMTFLPVSPFLQPPADVGTFIN